MILGQRFGDRGAYTELVQLALTRAGAELMVDGVFGVRTQDALISFQTSKEIEPSGYVDAQTEEELRPYLLGYRIVETRNGDSFYNLAVRYSTTVSAIRLANPQVRPQNLPSGTLLTVPLGFDLVATNVHYTYYYLSLLVNGLLKRYPFCSVASIGQSVLGKRLYCLQIGRGRQALMYNGAHHANEWITVPLLMCFFERYAAALASGTSIFGLNAQSLYEKTNLFVVPMVNPDGVDLVNGVASDAVVRSAKDIANKFSDIPFPSGWKANIEGVDINLNYPAQWERAKAIKFAQGYDMPAPRDYVGTAPLTAPESQAMANLTRTNDFLLTLSYHSQGEVIYWKFDDYLPPRSLEIGEAFSKTSGYALELTPTASGAAGYKDWFIQEYNRPGYTVEVGRGENPLPLSQFDEIYKNNLGIMALGMYLL